MTQLKSLIMSFFLRCREEDIDEESIKDLMMKLSSIRQTQNVNLVEYASALAADLAFMAAVTEEASQMNGYIHEVMTLFNGVFGESYTIYKDFLKKNPVKVEVESPTPTQAN